MIRKTIVFIVVLVLFSFFDNNIYAKDAKEASPSAHIQYELAYPGILPDNPLYKLKQLRDKLISFLITDPKKRIEFYLLQADKGMLATAMLIDKEDFALAEKTLLRAEHNMTLLNNEFPRMPKKPDNEMFLKLKTASLKHQEVLNSFIERLPKDKRKTFEQVLGFSIQNSKMVEKYEKKSPSRWNLPDY